MERRLIVARMDPGDAQSVAEVFAESDAGALPGLIGVTGRSLFHYNGLYFHLIEAETSVRERIDAKKTDPLFQDVSRKLEPYIAPYDPQTWQGPADAMATRFYSWRAK
ncbi:TcmI family type II polyketide cyclase [Streptomyces morookaense]|uniref:TcmI family type II polyketide cyclase n=1 Tax=Streptomyces morookaense TaxID=1970 RepID=A0A7Y7B5B2_STRMO|nr:TcmI family type II polyketide cyclase [Streptomyces morookaense]NVK79149.1 TcmI family type II polyketide cyclase [Streptomyces morookaense]GHF28178.1 polyketide synthase [Streptomyces morookaense]